MVHIGDFEELVLLAIIAQGDDAYGRAITKTLEDITGHRVTEGAVSSTLRRMRDKGWIDVEIGLPTNQRGGRAKTYYTVKGKTKVYLDVLHAVRQTLRKKAPK